MEQATTEQIRCRRIARLIEGTQAAEDGQLEEFESEPAQFLVVEYSDEDPLFAMAANTLAEAAKCIDESETMRDSVIVYDLDSKDEWMPVFGTVKLFKTKNGQPEVYQVKPQR